MFIGVINFFYAYSLVINNQVLPWACILFTRKVYFDDNHDHYMHINIYKVYFKSVSSWLFFFYFHLLYTVSLHKLSLEEYNFFCFLSFSSNYICIYIKRKWVKERINIRLFNITLVKEWPHTHTHTRAREVRSTNEEASN